MGACRKHVPTSDAAFEFWRGGLRKGVMPAVNFNEWGGECGEQRGSEADTEGYSCVPVNPYVR